MRPNDGFCVSWTMIRNRMCNCHHFCHPKLKIWRPLNHLDVTWPWSLRIFEFSEFSEADKNMHFWMYPGRRRGDSREKLHSYLFQVHLKSKRRHFSETETVLTYGPLLPTLEICQTVMTSCKARSNTIGQKSAAILESTFKVIYQSVQSKWHINDITWVMSILNVKYLSSDRVRILDFWPWLSHVKSQLEINKHPKL